MAAAQSLSGGLGCIAHQGDVSRRLAARTGKKRAIVAVAHTILVSLYHMLKNKQTYRELGADFMDRRYAENVKRYLLKRLERLGLQVTVQSSADTAALPA